MSFSNNTSSLMKKHDKNDENDSNSKASKTEQIVVTMRCPPCF